MAVNGPIIDLQSKQQMTPYAIVMVIPFEVRSTYNFLWRTHRANPENAVNTRDPVFIHPRLLNINVSSSKSTHVGTFSGVFKDPDNFIMRNVMPDDWMAVWMFDNEDDAARVLKKIKASLSVNDQEGEKANGFNDGFKFLGRVDSVRRVLQKDDSGIETKTVSITGSSFTELDSQVYYNPLLGKNGPNELYILAATEHSDKFFSQVKDTRLAHVNDILPLAIDHYLGGGPVHRTELEQQWNPNQAYVIPEAVTKLLGVKPRTSPPTYSDILTTIVGVQQYEPDAGPMPTLKEPEKSTNRLFTPQPILSVFNPMAMPWSGTPVWQIINSYLNPAINEMYTCLRPTNKDGDVMPTLVIRQKPFTTEEYTRGDGHKLPVTLFKNLPRWRCHHSMVYSLNVGRSRALYFNHAEVQLTSGGGNGIVVTTAALAEGIAKSNVTGIRRSGLRRFSTTVLASPEDIRPDTDSRQLADAREVNTPPHGDWDSDSAIPNASDSAIPNASDSAIPNASDSVGGIVTSGFGMRYHPTLKVNRMHNGVDLGYPEGTPVPAYLDGIIESMSFDRRGGNIVVIKHPHGWRTKYMHLSKFHHMLKVGQSVTRNQVIGYVGSTGEVTGAHLHFEVWMGNEPKDPLLFAKDYMLIHGQTGPDTEPAAIRIVAEPSPTFEAPVTMMGSKWSELVADMMFDSHLKYNGTVTLYGIQAPIAEGDNFEYDGVVYHIEQVTHTLQVNPSTGQRLFRTTLNLSNGMSTIEGEFFPEMEAEAMEMSGLSLKEP